MPDKMETSSSPDSEVTTPKEQHTIDTSALSPPDSQQRSMPLSTSGSSLANSNGKRPIQTISNGNDDVEGRLSIYLSCLLALHMLTLLSLSEIASMGNGGVGSTSKPSFATAKTHPSGYTWNTLEDEPGYSWSTKKAQDEYKRAADQMVHKESMIRASYGDIFEVVENEKAMQASLQQR